MPPVIDKEKCIGCTTCAQICPLDVYGPVVKSRRFFTPMSAGIAVPVSLTVP